MNDTVTLPRSVVEQALEAHQALRDWIHAVPQTVVLPAMPGVDGDWLDDVESTLHTALEQPQDHQIGGLDMVPVGWKLVPVEPADSQIRAAQDTWWHACNCETYWDQIYAAMIAAAPQPQSVTDCHQSQPQREQEPNPRWPSNASEVRAFLSGRVATERYARDDHQPDDNDTYTLSAHDLLEAIDWWTDFDTQPKRQPLTDEEISDLWGMQLFRLTDLALAKDFARDIERAHGIVGAA